ncbi:MAG: signal peptidase I [Bdellovibrionales bacterium]|nr:signal peptidase I [Bdellovibrionales bacterium]
MSDKSYILERPKSPSNRLRKASLVSSLLTFFTAIMLILTLRWGLAEPYVIPSGSMMPTLLIHDHILVNKLAYGLRIPFSKKWIFRFSGPNRGDVVVFRSTEDDDFYLVKRVIGLPGDKIVMSANGQLWINQKAMTRQHLLENNSQMSSFTDIDLADDKSQLDFYLETYTPTKKIVTQANRSINRSEIKEITVPKNHLFLMGDNRDKSRDSRYWGTLPMSNLIGKAMFVWLSCEKTLASAPFLCDPSTIRWNRFFHAVK